MGPQCLEDLIDELISVSIILANVVKHIAEQLLSLGPLCPVDRSLLVWINNEHRYIQVTQ